MSPWLAIRLLFGLSKKYKEDPELPAYALVIAQYTSEYEEVIRELWEKFKKNPSVENAEKFAKALAELVDTEWEKLFTDILNLDKLSEEQKQYLDDQINNHKGFIDSSLLPDMLKEIDKGSKAFNNLDYRVIFLYSGALWSFGFLSTIMWDGLELRDAADLFMFIGPKDESTCMGDNGCEQHVNKIYTVAEILLRGIIPGQLKCLTNCRHMLIPITSPL